jgi:hypothetical protein
MLVVPALIRDSSDDGFSQLYQEGSADQQLPGSSCFRMLVRHAGAGLKLQTDKSVKSRKD